MVRVPRIDRLVRALHESGDDNDMQNSCSPYVVYFLVNKGQHGMHKAIGCQKHHHPDVDVMLFLDYKTAEEELRGLRERDPDVFNHCEIRATVIEEYGVPVMDEVE